MKWRNWLIVVVLLVLLVVAPVLSEVPNAALWQHAQTFVTIFLGIFVEATPFLLAGAVMSGIISEFIEPAWVARLAPRHPLTAALAGTLLGMVFPVCECGVVPVTRRLYQKGLPLATGVSFLLAAPVLNPVVIASTLAAYGWSVMFWGRMGAALVIALAVGALFHYAEPEAVLCIVPHACPLHDTPGSSPVEPTVAAGRGSRIWHALSLAGDEFLEMVQYLIAGCLLAAGMQILVPKAALLTWGDTSVPSIVALLVLAFVMSICSTVDAFVSLAFVNTFTPGAVLAFLVFGPMVDIKSLLLFRQVFRPRATAYLVVLPLLVTAIFAVLRNMGGG